MQKMGYRYDGVCGLMGAASGLPLVASGSVLQAWYTQSHQHLLWVGALTWIGLPYLFKWVWAPWLDRYPAPYGGRRRGWILCLQVHLMLLWWLMSYFSPLDRPLCLMILAFIGAFFSATQDVLIDAYRTEWVPATKMAACVAAYVTGYRMAVLLGAGVGLLMAAHWGWPATYRFFAVMMGGIGVLIACVAPPLPCSEALSSTGGQGQSWYAAFSAFFDRVHAKREALCLLSYKLTDVFAFSLTLPFLLRGLGFTLTEIGLAYKVISVSASVLGGFWGARYWGQMPRFLALRWGIIAQAGSLLGLVVLSLWGRHFGLMCVAIFLESFFSGASTVPLLAWISDLSAGPFTGSQFAFLTALTSVGRVCLGPLTATWVLYCGWTPFFVLCALMGLPAWYCVYALEKRVHCA